MNYKDLKIHFRYLSGNIACLSVDSINGKSVRNDINDEEAIIIFNSLVGKKEGCQNVESLLKKYKKQKEVINKAVLELVNIDGNLSNSQLSDRICNLIDILKEVSE